MIFTMILLYSIIFVLLFSTIDGCQNRQKDILSSYSFVPTDKVEKMKRYSGIWHILGLFRNIFIGVQLMLIVYLLTKQFSLSVKAGMIYMGIFTMFTDGIINMWRGLGFNFYGTVDSKKWDWSDWLWNRLRDGWYVKIFGVVFHIYGKQVPVKLAFMIFCISTYWWG